MSALRKLRVTLCAFACAMYAAAPVLADDTEIYIGGGSSSSSGFQYPNVVLLLDTSGSMLFPMYTKYPSSHPSSGTTVPTSSCGDAIGQTLSGCATNPDDRRGTHLKTAVTRLLETLDGDIRVGLSRYNSDGHGGRMVYPARRLDDKVSTSSTQSTTYTVSASADDANQLGSLGSALVTNTSTLSIGNAGTLTTVTTMANANNTSYQCNSNTNSVVNATRLFLGAGSIGSPYSSCQSNLGMRFGSISVPAGAVVVSASITLTHNSSSLSSPDASRPADNGSFNVTLQMENSIAPATYATSGGKPVNDSSRVYYTAASLPPAAAVPFDVGIAASDLVSGGTEVINVTNMVTNQVSNASWSNTSSIAFRLLGQAAYSATLKNSRVIDTGTTKGPVLSVTYYTTSTSRNFTGIRFSSIDIPQNATVTSAQLNLVSSSAASSPAGTTAPLWEVAMDPTVTPIPGAQPFNATYHLDSSRWTGSSTTTYSPGNWTSGTTYSIDVTSMLNAQVNKTDYCGGNAVAFRLRDTIPIGASSQRMAYSYDNSSSAPTLSVTYTLPATGTTTCTQVKRVASVRSEADDAEHTISGTGSGTQNLGGASLKIASTTAVGLRFGNISVPRGVTIRTATLQVKATNTPSNRGTISITGAKLANVVAFSDTNKANSLAATTASASWAPAAWATGTSYTSVDLSNVIQEIINQTDWDKGNALALVLKGNQTTGQPQMAAVDAGASGAAVLSITYLATDPDDAIRRVRQDLIETAQSYVFGGGTPLGDTFYEVGNYMLGNSAYFGQGYTATGNIYATPYADAQASQTAANVYKSPIDGNRCQSNNIIMLTDGAPSGDGTKYLGTGTGCGSASASAMFKCMNSTAKYLHDTGKISTGVTSADSPKVNTYTIGFGPEVTDTTTVAYTGLNAVANDYGGGDFFAATDADVLVSNFQSIFAQIADVNSSMASPGVAVNQLNRSQNLDQLYYGVFKPSATKRWVGNVKRYKLGLDDAGNDAVLGLTATGANKVAVDANTKFFAAGVYSYWSTGMAAPDGNKADEGGAAYKQNTAITVYTDSGSAGAMTALDPATSSTWPSGWDANLVNWIRGIDVDDDNGNGSSTDARQSLGAPIHPQPVLVPYGNTDEDFVVFISTNDGLLHSINNSDGTENWAWLPSDLQSNVALLKQNDGMGSSNKPIYGLDGAWTYVKAADGTKLLIGGMRQGGSNYYAIKLPTSKTGAPTLKWVIKPGTTGFSRLGRTWSQPVYAKVRTGSSTKTVKEVLIFGAGMDYSTYESGGASAVSTGTDAGNAVYMVDLLTGDLIWSGSASGTPTTTVSSMVYSVPGSVRVIDKNGDQLADHIYFADTGGQVFRVDLDNSTSATALVKRVALLATLGTAEQVAANQTTTKQANRRFYETPAVSYAIEGSGATAKIFAAVAIGSGDRSYPKSNTTTQDRIFLIKDYDAARFDILGANITATGDGTSGIPDLATFPNPIGTANLADVSSIYGSTADTAISGQKGWYITLGGTGRVGEKVLSSPYIFSARTSSGLVFQIGFNTYLPGSTLATSCAPVAGTTSLYSLALTNGSGVTDFNNDGTVSNTERRIDDVAVGISGNDTGLIRSDGSGGYDYKRVTGTNAETAGKVPDGLNHMKRTRWYDKR